MTNTTFFPEWVQAHKDADPLLPEIIRTMRNKYGRIDVATCQKCIHLKRVSYHVKTYLKCDETIWTHGPGTDRKAHWPACGLFSEVSK